MIYSVFRIPEKRCQRCSEKIFLRFLERWHSTTRYVVTFLLIYSASSYNFMTFLRFSDQNIVTLECKSHLFESLPDFMRRAQNEILFCLSTTLIQRELMQSSFKWHIKIFQTILCSHGESHEKIFSG